jgi:xanthine dehydrogenase accessory factor
MRDLLSDYDRLAAQGRPLGRAVVTSVWGSAPRPEGSSMLATADGVMAGSVSGGCVEGATATEIGEAIGRGTPKLVTFGVSHERAWEVGLACGGTIKVFVEPAVRPEVLAAARGPGGEVVATVVEGPGTGGTLRIFEDGRTEGSLGAAIPAAAVRDAALDALRHEASATLPVETGAGAASVFLEVYPRQPRLVVFGGVHIAVALVPLARALGYRTIVADGRPAFLTRERFPNADQLILAWPEAAFEQIGLDASCYVCILSHDPKFDEPALQLALRSPARYIGAIGSRKTQASRREWLRSSGFDDAEIARVHGPIGLDLGGRQPAETALAILAQMTAVRYGRKS